MLANKINVIGKKSLLFLLLVNVVVFAFIIKSADLSLRQRFERQGKKILTTIDLKRLKNLSGTAADMEKEDYVFLRRQLSLIAKNHPVYKFLYFMGKTEDGKMFLYADNITAGMESCIDAESRYPKNMSSENTCTFGLSRVDKLHKGLECLCISLFISLDRPMYGNIDAVFGLDIAVSRWIWLLFKDVSVMISFGVIVFLTLVFFFFPYSFLRSREEVITRKIMPYVAFIVVAMTLVFIVSLFKQQGFFIQKIVAQRTNNIPLQLKFLLEKEQQILRPLVSLVTSSANLKKNLHAEARGQLESRYRVFFETLSEKDVISHFSFYSPEGINILRLHSPDFGDFANRYNLKKAKADKSVVSGIELDSNGDVILRVVEPVYDAGVLFGFVEIGNRLETVIHSIDVGLDADVAIFIKKEYLNKEAFEVNRGGIIDWEDFGSSVLVYNTYQDVEVSKEYFERALVSAGEDNRLFKDKIFSMNAGNRTVYSSIAPFFDIEGRRIGHIVVMYDYMEVKKVFANILRVGLAVLFLLLCFIIFALYFILQATDKNIMTQHGNIIEREAYLSAMVTNLSDAVIITDEQGDILTMNPAAEKLTGCLLEQKEKSAVNKVFSNLIDLKGSKVESPVDIVIRTKKKMESEENLIYISNEGVEFFITYSATPIISGKGSFMGVVLFVRDVTHEYKQLKKVDFIAEKLQVALDSSDIGVWEYDVHRKHLVWDDNMRTIYDVGVDFDIDIQVWGDKFLHPEDKEKILKEISSNIGSGRPLELEARIITATGEVRFIKGTAASLDNGFRYVGINYDVTEQKKIESKIKQSEKEINLLIENAVNVITVNEMIFDGSGHGVDYVLRKVNKAFERFIGLERENVLGEKASDVLKDMQTPDMLEVFSEVIRSGISIHLNKYSQALDCWYSVHAYKIEGNHFAMMFYDISERKKNEEKMQGIIERDRKQVERFRKSQQIALSIMEDANNARKEAEKLKSKAEKAYQTKSQFLANMSHEIRTPMNAILGYGDLLGKTYLKGEQVEFLKMISSSGELLLGIINDILDVSKFEAGRIALETIEFNLSYLCSNVFKFITPQIKDKQIETSIEIAPDVPMYCKGDPTRLRQVLINLLANAVKFTRKGSIGLKVACKGVDKTGKYNVLEFRVKDTGIGIAKAKQQDIFQAFDQGNDSITRQYGGTGLGLTICKAVVEAMGGDISVVSVKGKGSEFIFTVKLLVIDEKDYPTNIKPLGEKELEGKKVIILDSMAKTRDLMIRYCKEKKMDVLDIYFDAKSFYRDINKYGAEGAAPDILLMDVFLSDDSGMDIAKEVKNVYSFAKTKLVAVTSDVRPGTSQSSFEAGFNGYLAKPFTKEDFFKVITFVLGDMRTQGTIVTRHVVDELGQMDELPESKGKGFKKDIKVLLAEDNIVNQKLMLEYFKVLGVSCDTAINGEIAVEKSKDDSYDLCFMDIQMPVLDGIAATSAIRENITKEQMPIVGISANVMDEHKRSAIEAGLDDYVKKPVKIGTIRMILEKWCK